MFLPPPPAAPSRAWLCLCFSGPEAQTLKGQMPPTQRAQAGSFPWPLGDCSALESLDWGTHQAESRSAGPGRAGLGWAGPGLPERGLLRAGVPGRAGEGQGAPKAEKGLKRSGSGQTGKAAHTPFISPSVRR